MKTLIILLTFFTSFFIRALRWLSILQQKEYRLDRLNLFLKTREGEKEFLRIFPKKSDFSRTGLKRPKITARVSLVAIIYFIELVLLIIFLTSISIGFLTMRFGGLIFILSLIIGLLILLLIIPFLIYLASLPTAIISVIKTYFELFFARLKVKKVNPIIVGITGSYGKTSTKILLAEVLQKKYSVFKTPKSYNTKFSVARSINKGYQNQQIMVIEYAAYKKGEIKTIASWFKPSMAVITGLTHQHLGLFGNIEAVVEAKAELISALPHGSKVICNGDDDGTIRICAASTNKGIQIIRANDENEKTKIIKAHLNKAGKLVFVWNGQQVVTNFIGIHYLQIIRMVILIAKEFDLSDQDIVEAISNFVPDDKFIFSYKTKSNYLVINDGGTTNPMGFEAAIKLASDLSAPKKTIVTSGIVDLGTESKKIHLDLATQAKQVFDKVLYVGESGKSEFNNVFEKDFIEGQKDVENYLSKIKDGEMILIEGRMPGWIIKYLK